MTLLSSRRIYVLPVLAAALLAVGASAQSHPSLPAPATAPESPYGGTPVEDILARVNDQIISRSDYDRSLKEKDAEGKQRGLTMQQVADGHKDLLRDLIDQQLLLSKGKELGITGETELIKQLDEIRKKYNLETMEDLEKAAREQGVSYEDFKAGIRNQIITSQVIRDEVAKRVSITPGEVQRFYEAHKQEYAQPETVRLSEILISTGAPAPSATDPNAVAPDDPIRVSTAKAKADDIEAKLKGGADFDQLARSSSDGTTAAEAGDLGKWERGKLNKIFEDATFSLKTGQFTEPIRTKQGYVILKVVEHVSGGVPTYKQVEQQVGDELYESRMAPAVRTYLTTLREEGYVAIRAGYTDSGASPKETPVYQSAYTPPAPKKKRKVQRTRFRETEHGFRGKGGAAVVPVSADTTQASAAASPAATSASGKSKAAASATPATMKAGKKEKIRYGQAPRETLPNAAETKVEDAGALPKVAENDAAEANNPLQPAAPPIRKTRYSSRAKLPKAPKPTGPRLDNFTPLPPDAAEVADRQVQAAPLALGPSPKPAKKPKKTDTATAAEKTRMKDRPKKESDKTPADITPAPTVPGAPAPAAPAKAGDAPAPATSPAPTADPAPSPQE